MQTFCNAAASTMTSAVAIVTAIALLGATYVLSYAPFVATMPRVDSSGYHRGYQPVEWLIDSTSLHAPLLAWGGLWSVSEQLAEDSYDRTHPPTVDLDVSFTNDSFSATTPHLSGFDASR